MPDFKLVSADSHVTEPAIAFDRVRKEYGDRAPRFVKDPPGVAKGIWMVTEGLEPLGVSHFSIGLVADKPDGISKMDLSKWQETVGFNAEFSFDQYPAGWEPAARLDAQDKDGVAAEILFPSPTRFFYAVTDRDFQRSIFNSYNSWLHDFMSYSPKRLLGMAMLSIIDVDQAVKDIHEYAALGFKGVILPSAIEGSGYYEEIYEPLWSALTETEMIAHIHTEATQGMQRDQVGTRKHHKDPRSSPLGYPHRTEIAEQFLGNLVLSGVFDRHPSLKVVCVEFDAGWVAHLYQQVDYIFGRASAYDTKRYQFKRLPSEYLNENVYFTFQDDRAAVLTTPIYGTNNYLWANDFPHGVTTWPYSMATVDSNFDGIDPSIKQKICRDNTIELYNLEIDD